MFDDWIRMKKIEWIEPPFEPEIDLNFLGINSKIKVSSKENKDES